MYYTFEKLNAVDGTLFVYDDDGTLIAQARQYCILDEHRLAQLNAHQPVPGNYFLSDDPRYYTYCQWCGESIEGRTSYYNHGQWHKGECEQHRPRR